MLISGPLEVIVECIEIVVGLVSEKHESTDGRPTDPLTRESTDGQLCRARKVMQELTQNAEQVNRMTTQLSIEAELETKRKTLLGAQVNKAMVILVDDADYSTMILGPCRGVVPKAGLLAHDLGTVPGCRTEGWTTRP